MTNPNNCGMCKHMQNPDGGHCYMFREAPTTVCHQHTARNQTFFGTAGGNQSVDFGDAVEATFDLVGDFLSSLGD